MSGAFRREIHFEPGYDHRAEDANKPFGNRRGCHGLNMRWLLHGERGTIQFLVYTSWLPSWVSGDQYRSYEVADTVHAPSPADFGWHWDASLYDGDTATDDCQYRPGGCHYDGSGLMAEPLFAALLTEGHEAVWRAMEERYAELDAETKR